MALTHCPDRCPDYHVLTSASLNNSMKFRNSLVKKKFERILNWLNRNIRMSLADFEFHRVTQVVFGKGKVNESLGSLLGDHGAKRILLTYGKSSIKKMGLYDEVIKILKEKKLDFWELSGIRPNPEVNKVREGIKLVREHNIDFILAVGGGSVIDCSKAISLGHGYEGDVWDVIHNWWRKAADKKDISITKFLKIGTILTLAATGSEFNFGCVISNDELGKKLGCMYKQNCPTFSILDPTYTMSVSKYQTRAGSFDILSHLLEFYFGNDAPFFTQKMTEAVIMTVLKYLPLALADPNDYEARSNLMWASSVALCGMTSSGRLSSGDWSNHSIEHECSAVKVDLPHGIGLAIVTMGWMRYVVNKRPERFLDLGRSCFPGMHDVTDANKVVDYLEDFLVKNDVPVYFADEESTKDWNVEDSKKAARTRFEHFDGEVGNYVPLKEQDVVNILNSRICKK